MDSRKVLLVFYSRSGTTRRVAEAIAEELKCDVEEILDVKSRKGLFGWLRSGSEAARKKLPEIKPTTKDAAQYDIVIIGTPVWASTMSSPLRTWLTRNSDKLIHNTAIFCTMGGESGGATVPDIGLFCHCDTLATMAVRTKDVKSGAFAGKVKEFAARLR